MRDQITMNKLWTVLLNKAIAQLMGLNWTSVIMQVSAMMSQNLTGDEKRQAVYNTLRSFGIDCATWLLYAAIEIAYGQLKANQK